jgi:hypothetical protein
MEMSDNQKIYDAMLIKAFRADISLGMLWFWLKPYNISPPDSTLKRQPPRAKMRVQAFVGCFLKPLADRLWDTDKTHDIKTLHWMDKLNCQNTSRVMSNDLQRLKHSNMVSRRKTKFLHNNLEDQKISNQWNTTK